MHLTHDPEADAVYIRLRPGGRPARTEHLDWERHIDYGEDGQPIGIEVLGISQGVDLSDLPEQEAVAHLLGEHQIAVVPDRRADPRHLLDRLAVYLARRMDEVDVTMDELATVDQRSAAFDIARRHGLATAFHEIWHLIADKDEPASPAP